MFTIAISDGLKPSYRGKGFILRKIIRKSIGIIANDFHISNARQLLSELSVITTDLLSEAFPELQHNIKIVNEVIEEEIEKYNSVVNQNKQIVEALNQLNIEYSIDLNEDIEHKLENIRHEINIKIEENSLNKELLESNKKYLFSIKDILSDYTINLRHNLSIDLNERIDSLIERLDKFENKTIDLFTEEFKSIKSMNDSKYFVHKILTKGDPKIAFKVGLDNLGERPTALFHICHTQNHLYIQTSVPKDYQKYLTANQWLFEISKQLNSFEILSKKRVNKMSSLKTNSFERIDEAISSAKKFAEIHFNKNN